MCVFLSSSLTNSVAKGATLSFHFLKVIRPKHSKVFSLTSGNIFLCTSDRNICDVVAKFARMLVEAEETCVKFILKEDCESRSVSFLEVPWWLTWHFRWHAN
ncbi:unnamed protein product [Rodentolepis nana]|uniref:Secreted protein n=1 Tax=Rodentolepis nana TaxID=102285 RepID=A0A0R3T663_RODNA|nr:unnamed protein product [Rodentolepis nana]